MELGPIFRALMHNKSRFWLVAVEVGLTLAIVVNCLNMMLDARKQFHRDPGVDEQNLLVLWTVPFDEELRDDDFRYALQEDDLRRLRERPDVIDAVAIRQILMSGGGSSASRWRMDDEPGGHGVGVPYFTVSENALNTLGVELVAGRDFIPEDFIVPEEDAENASGRNIIVTQALADVLFPDGAVGHQVRNSGGEIVDTIVGVIAKMHNSWPRSEFAQNGEGLMLRPGRPSTMRGMNYMVRLQPGAIDEAYTQMEDFLLAGHPGRTVRVETLLETKADYYDDNLVMMKMLSAVIALLLLVTSLGIVGLTSFSVTQRTHQIGTRRALGATRSDIVRYFLVENWMITGMGITIGLLLTYGLNYVLVQVADAPKIEWTFLALGALALWITGVLAAVAPAIRASGVEPEIATRTV